MIDPIYALSGDDGLGLPFGVGDPAEACLHKKEWMVVRIDDRDGLVFVRGPRDDIVAARFSKYTVLYRGDRRGALEAIISLGADSDAMSVRLAKAGPNGVAEAGDYGVAIAGPQGYARAGFRGQAYASLLAIAGHAGRAELDAPGGVARVGAYGAAFGQDDCILSCSGPDGVLVGGAASTAWSRHDARSIRAGRDSRVLAMKQVRRVAAGDNAVVVVMEAVEGQTRIKAGSGSLIILRVRGACTGTHKFVVAMPGAPGLEADRDATVSCDGFGNWRFSPCLADRREDELGEDAAQDYRTVDAVFAPRALLTEAQTEADLLMGHAASDLSTKYWVGPTPIIILCNCDSPDIRESGLVNIFAKVWDPDPRSPDGISGLLWGIGDPVAAGLGYGEDWALVSVMSYVVTAPLDEHGHPGAVKFRGGRTVFSGSRRQVLERLAAMGADRERLVGRVEICGPRGLARVGCNGAAQAAQEGWAFASSNSEATAGESGFAEAGLYGTATAGRDGIAIAGEGGTAVAGEGGVAISRGKRYGTAVAGFRGLALGDGRFKTVRAGSEGVALATEHGCRVSVGDDGVALGFGDIRAGRHGVAITLGGTVTGGDGCLLVARLRKADGSFDVRSALVGSNGVLPDIRYAVRNGALAPATD